MEYTLSSIILNKTKLYEGPRTVNGLLSEILSKNNKIKIYNFNVKWCKYSVQFESEWNTFVNSLKASDNIEAINVNCDNSQNEYLYKKFNINKYPTIIIEKDNDIIYYNEERTSKHIRKYLGLN